MSTYPRPARRYGGDGTEIHQQASLRADLCEMLVFRCLEGASLHVGIVWLRYVSKRAIGLFGSAMRASIYIDHGTA